MSNVEMLGHDEAKSVFRLATHQAADGQMFLEVVVAGACVLRMHGHYAARLGAQVLAACAALKAGVEGDWSDPSPGDLAHFDRLLTLTLAQVAAARVQQLNAEMPANG